MLDNLTMAQFVHNVQARVRGADVYAHRESLLHCLETRREALRADSRRGVPFDVWTASLRCLLLAVPAPCKALERGVRYRSCHVTHATLDERANRIGCDALRRDDCRPTCS